MTEHPPKLPAEVSSDGREIWAWGNALSEWAQRQHDRRTTWADLVRVGTGCGDCDKWMKSRECPREHNVNGQTRGPSAGTPTCGQFVISRSAAARRDVLNQRYASLSSEAQSLGLEAGLPTVPLTAQAEQGELSGNPGELASCGQTEGG